MKRAAILLLVVLTVASCQGMSAQEQGAREAQAASPVNPAASPGVHQAPAAHGRPPQSAAFPPGATKPGVGVQEAAPHLLDTAQAVVQQFVRYYRRAVSWLERHGLLLS